jgi:hypothetical protein
MFLSNKPIFDGTYIYDRINRKIEEGKEINIYEQFYLWSFNNRNKVLLWLFILLIIILIVNSILICKNNKITLSGGDNNKQSSEPSTKEESGYFKRLGSNIKNKFIKNVSFNPNRNINNMSTYELKIMAQSESGLINRINTFFPLIDKFFKKVYKILIKTKLGIIIAVIFIIYCFGIVIITLIVLFFIIKFTIKAVKKTFMPFKEYKLDKKKSKKN